jgi:putative DNA-invertase from lambdoid prophage Rac
MNQVVFAYARVSTNEQTVENQRLEIHNAGYVISDEFWFADSGVSGSVPALERSGGETLVVSKLDRLGRDSVDVMNNLTNLKKMKVKVIVLQLGNMDLNSAAGKLMLTMLSAVAEMEKTLLIERTKAGQKRAWEIDCKQKGRPLLTNQVQRQQIRTELNAGISVSQVAREHQLSRGTVISIRKGEQTVS